MPYDKTDELAINTIRTLAVRSYSLPRYRWVFLNDAFATNLSQLLTAFCPTG